MPASERLSPGSVRGRLASVLLPRHLFALAFLMVAAPALPAQVPPEQAAQMLLTAARQAYTQKEYKFAADRFREFLAKNANHKQVPAARYGLALALVEGPDRDYLGAIEQLNALVGAKDSPDYPFVLYYLGLSQRGQGVKLLAQAAQKPAEANALRAVRRGRAGVHGPRQEPRPDGQGRADRPRMGRPCPL